MFTFLKSLLSRDADQPPLPLEGREKVATAALLIEAALADDHFDDVEREAIVNVLVRHYQISDAEAREVVRDAEVAHQESDQFFYFTRTIKDSFPFESRVQMIEMLWEIVYADGKLGDYEANLVRRIAGLIYVSDRDRGDARKRVLVRLGISDD
ncbi:tellurite resistance TerB family protein [Sneathiella sp.]|uniref:tellurite resistance TerB family protein n=1 Tax=Sneathiella sp. TaxID=1964365 RepID=UPI002FE0ED5B